ncbi:MAG: hypothetical protein ACYC7A_21260 [Thermoanaerobaculia bacterium]
MIRLWIPVAILLIAATAASQVTARQGEPADDPENIERFESPMILEVPFRPTDKGFWGDEGKSPAFLSRFRCDGVSIALLHFRTAKTETGDLTIDVNGLLRNEPGIDRLVTVRFVVIDGDTEIARAYPPWRNLDVEEGKQNVPRPTRIVVASDKLRDAKAPKLRLTVEVTVND